MKKKRLKSVEPVKPIYKSIEPIIWLRPKIEPIVESIEMPVPKLEDYIKPIDMSIKRPTLFSDRFNEIQGYKIPKKRPIEYDLEKVSAKDFLNDLNLN